MDRRWSSVSVGDSPRSSVSSRTDGMGFGDFRATLGEPWEEDTPNCGACGAKLGRLRRHHCRICGMCVCSGCSPNSVHLEGSRRPQRACTPCVAASCSVPVVKRRLAQVGASLLRLGGERTTSDVSVAPTLLEAAALCEGAVLPVEQALADARARAERAEAELESERRKAEELAAELSSATACLLRAAERIHASNGSKPCEPPAPNCGSGEAVEACDAALGTLRGRSRLLSREPREPSVQGTPLRTRAASRCSIMSSTPEDGTTCGLTSPEARPSADWEENTEDCSCCGAKIGKRYLRPRHHCRLCGRCVCAQCSPSTLQLEGQKGPQRVCAGCATDAQQAGSVKRRALQLGVRLRSLARAEDQEEAVDPPVACSLALAFSYCEAGLEPLEALRSGGEAASPASECRLTGGAVDPA